MSESTQPPEGLKPAQVIADFPELYPREVGRNEYRVLSLSNGDTTAHEVNIRQLSCTCKANQYQHVETGEICKHVAAALFQADAQVSVEDMVLADLGNISESMHRTLTDMEDVANEVNSALPKLRDAEASVEASQNGAQSSQNGSSSNETWDGDPEKEVRKKLVEYDLDPADFKIEWDGKRVTAEIDGFIDDFDSWQEMTSEIGMDYDGDVNYLEASEFPEVFG